MQIKGRKLNTDKMMKNMRRQIKDYYVRKRQAEMYDCKCYECRHFDDVNCCCKKRTEAKDVENTNDV